MEIVLSQSVENKLNNASILLGYKKQELINRAIMYYLDSINTKIEFEQELKSLDILSDEALENFEKTYSV